MIRLYHVGIDQFPETAKTRAFLLRVEVVHAEICVQLTRDFRIGIVTHDESASQLGNEIQETKFILAGPKIIVLRSPSSPGTNIKLIPAGAGTFEDIGSCTSSPTDTTMRLKPSYTRCLSFLREKIKTYFLELVCRYAKNTPSYVGVPRARKLLRNPFHVPLARREAIQKGRHRRIAWRWTRKDGLASKWTLVLHSRRQFGFDRRPLLVFIVLVPAMIISPAPRPELTSSTEITREHAPN